MADKTDTESKICPKHKIQMVPVYQGPFMRPEYDEDGNQTGESEEEIYDDICHECEFEQKMAEYSLSDLPDVVEKSIREYQQSPFRKPIEKPKDKDFIGKYSRFIASVKSVPDYIAEASCEFLISIA